MKRIVVLRLSCSIEFTGAVYFDNCNRKTTMQYYKYKRRLGKPRCYERNTFLYEILECHLRNEIRHRSNSKSALPILMTLCLLIPSRYLFSTHTGCAYSPVLNRPSLITEHSTRTTSRIIPRWGSCSLYTKIGDHDERNTKLTVGAVHTQPREVDDHDKSMMIQNDIKREVTEIIPMIRQCISMLELRDKVELYQQHRTHNSTVVAEITQRFAHLLQVRYSSRKTNTTSIGSQHNDSAEGKILLHVLNFITSMFDHVSYRNIHTYQYLLDAVNCFVGLTNALQTYVLQHGIKSNQQNLIIPVINRLWNRIIEHEQQVNYDHSQSIIYNMPPKRLVSFLLAIHKLHQFTSTKSDLDENLPDKLHNMNASSIVYANTCRRLCHGDRINRMSLHDIYQALKSINTSSSSPWNVCNNPVTQQLLISLVRRIRKPIVYNETETLSTTVQVLDQMQRLWYSINATFGNEMNGTYATNRSDDPQISSLSREVQISMYQLLCYIIDTSVPTTVNHSHTTTCKPPLSIKEVGILAVTLRIVIPRKSEAMEPNTISSRYSSLVMQFHHLATQVCSVKLNPISQNEIQRTKLATIRDISRVLSTWEYYRYLDFCGQSTSEGIDSNQSTHEMIQTLGHFTKQIVVEGTGNVDVAIKPSDINDILRTLAFLPESYSKQSYCSALHHLIVQNSEFLRGCSVTELSNFCWFMAFKSGHYFYLRTSASDAVIVALGNRIVQPDICHTCNPKQACRILRAFTALCCDTRTTDRTSVIWKFGYERNDMSNQTQRYGSVLSNLFQCLGECLLESSALSPRDASSAIYAYAKAQYVYDLGIFDHLVNSFAAHVRSNPSSCTLRQICQTLWACGKMVSFESSSNAMDVAALDLTKHVNPPYFKSMVSMISHVISYADELSVQDITQTLWTMSHFDLLAYERFNGDKENVDINIEPLLTQVIALISAFNTYERATLLWSFSRMPVLTPTLARIIFLITRPFAQPSNVEHLAIDEPQAASIILYSLGRMNIRDIDVFRYLTNHVLEYQIETASAQAIANILWAHRSVHIEPPKQLLESWAMLKLPDLNIVVSSDTGSSMWPYIDHSTY